DFTKVEINVAKGIVNKRSTKELLLIDPFHDRNIGVCNVKNGAARMNELFGKLKDKQDLGACAMNNEATPINKIFDKLKNRLSG
ncbi:hypothetical protein PMAYCL1PPCAC_13906, partial [Pristionchus mayeri]